jgi:hypothetical protein
MSSGFEKQIALTDDINFLLSKIRIAFAARPLYLKYGIQIADTASKVTQSATAIRNSENSAQLWFNQLFH